METNDQYSSEEAAKRRDAIIRNMIATPPQPHKPKTKKKRASPAKAKKRAPSA